MCVCVCVCVCVCLQFPGGTAHRTRILYPYQFRFGSVPVLFVHAVTSYTMQNVAFRRIPNSTPPPPEWFCVLGNTQKEDRKQKKPKQKQTKNEHTHTHTHARTRTHARTHAHTHTHTRTRRARTQAHARTHARTHTHAHIHTQKLLLICLKWFDTAFCAWSYSYSCRSVHLCSSGRRNSVTVRPNVQSLSLRIPTPEPYPHRHIASKHAGSARKHWPEAIPMILAHRLASGPDALGPNMTRPSRSDPGLFCTAMNRAFFGRRRYRGSGTCS